MDFAELKSVLKQFGRFRLQDLALHQGSEFAIGSRPDPLHRTPGFTSASKSAPAKMIRFDSRETRPPKAFQASPQNRKQIVKGRSSLS
jgi:hypothetical protein